MSDAKIYPDATSAIADLVDGDSIMSGGFVLASNPWDAVECAA